MKVYGAFYIVLPHIKKIRRIYFECLSMQRKAPVTRFLHVRTQERGF